jgi:putative FmdB family regulatory protein
MPFYEYHCTKCGHHHEELQKVTDRPLRKCPECGRNTLTRLMSAPVFRLKGGGWYETDFKSDKEGKRNLAGEKEPAEKAPAEKAPAEKAPAEKAPAVGAAKAAPENKPEPAKDPKESSRKSMASVRKSARAKPAARKPSKAAGRKSR